MLVKNITTHLCSGCDELACVAANKQNNLKCPSQRLSYVEWCSDLDVEYSVMVTGSFGSSGQGVLTVEDGDANCLGL